MEFTIELEGKEFNVQCDIEGEQKQDRFSPAFEAEIKNISIFYNGEDWTDFIFAYDSKERIEELIWSEIIE